MKWQEVGRSCITLLFSKYNYNNQIKKDEIGGACSRMGEKRSVKARRKETTGKTKT
jgi:hypothetical protein